MSVQTSSEIGEVIKILPGNRAQIKVKKSSICQSCSHRNFCDPFGSEHMLLEANNQILAQVGQSVRIEFRLEKPLKAMFILYLIPLSCFLVGAVVGHLINPFNNQDASAAILSICFLIISFIAIRWINQNKLRNYPSLEPKITGIVSS